MPYLEEFLLMKLLLLYSCEKTTCVHPIQALLTNVNFDDDCGTVTCNESASAIAKRAGDDVQAKPAGKGEDLDEYSSVKGR